MDRRYAETAILNFSRLSYDLQRYKDAFGGYSSLLQEARIENNKHTARVGMMRSAYKAGDWTSAQSCADKVKADGKSTAAEIREADYFKAKSLLSMNEREAAFEIFASLSSAPSTAEGAEAAYMIIQDACDQGRYDTVEKKVYAFAEKAGTEALGLRRRSSPLVTRSPSRIISLRPRPRSRASRTATNLPRVRQMMCLTMSGCVLRNLKP